MDERFSLAGRVAVVTGASRGLGRAVALALAKAGADLALAARSAEGLAETAAAVRDLGRRALVVPTDVTNWDEVQHLARDVEVTYGRADVLVNNAGVLVERPLLETEVDEWRRVFDTNLHGIFYCCQAFGRLMVRQGYGSVINMSSAFSVMAVPNLVSYCTSKAAISHFTRTLAMEWAPYNIRVNAIAPGYIESEMNAELRTHPERLERVLRRIPMRRMGQAEEIGPLVVYLASDASAYMTGEVILLDGGMAAR